MKTQPGYPLPSGELGSDDIVCQLVYLPDRPEYWQAFYAALHYMTTWRAWERDSDKRGQDAAANWRAAFELTSGCWRMTCMEQLQDDVAAILAIMQTSQSCCDDMDITDGDQYTDRVEDGEGNVPQNIIDAGYASGTSDWAGFDDYKCMISHVTVNQMEARLREISERVSPYGAIFGGVAALAGILAVIASTGGLAIVFGLIAGIGSVSLLYAALIEFDLIEDLADDVADAHEELACAIYHADGDVAALVALNDKIDELFNAAEAVILKNLNNGPTLKALYSGRYDQQDIAEILFDAGYELGDFDCECLLLGDYRADEDFNDGTYGNYQDDGASLREFDGMGGTYGCALWYANDAAIWISVSALGTEGGIALQAGDIIKIHYVLFSYKNVGGTVEKIRLELNNDGPGTTIIDYDFSTSWVHVQKNFSPPLEVSYNNTDAVAFKSLDSINYVMLDDITVLFDVYRP